MQQDEISSQNTLRRSQGTLYSFLNQATQKFFTRVHSQYRLTFQELRRLSEIARDLDMWGQSFEVLWLQKESEIKSDMPLRSKKKRLIQKIEAVILAMKCKPRIYFSDDREKRASRKRPLKVLRKQIPETILGRCPARTAATLCCGLITLDAVENCAFECSYCAVKPFYDDQITMPDLFRQKLESIKLDPKRFYHIGTGQASDSLAWGNIGGILDDLCAFATAWPNVLLELKTKSDHVDFLLRRKIPDNVVCSWSLNTQCIIDHEEHGSADLDARLEAARQAASAGIKIAFHFHPMVFYEGGSAEYSALAKKIQSMFHESQIAFISFGTLVFSKPTLRQIRERGGNNRILQMEMAKGAHGKATYPESVRRALFRQIYHAFEAWHGRVFMYLCMEDIAMRNDVFGRQYEDPSCFESDFFKKVSQKITLKRASESFRKKEGLR